MTSLVIHVHVRTLAWWLQAHYGKWEASSVQKVKAVFNELNLQQVYRDYEETSYAAITSLIDDLQLDLNKDVFRTLVNKIYKRQK